MLRVTEPAAALIVLAQALFPTAPPGVSSSDAVARASGNMKPAAIQIGRALFATQWPAQVLNVYADGFGGFRVAGLHLSGVRFHHALTRAQFESEITELVARTFAVSGVDEVDVWASVPLRVGKDIVVSGDLAKPTSRTVFTVSVRRGERPDALEGRLRQGTGVFWDQDWARTALK
ncbi:MAG TPA: hypothetical protein VGZ02_01920 [Candidatus Baltobacteraceae bacterium]|nr:hypothetical protein [Candidatus Baltobacteraceae bacterium]